MSESLERAIRILAEEVLAEDNLPVDWSFPEVTILKPPSEFSSDGSGSKPAPGGAKVEPVGPKPKGQKPKPGKGDPGKGKPEEEDGEPSGGKPGEGEPGEGGPGGNQPSGYDPSTGASQNLPLTTDAHGYMKKSDGSTINEAVETTAGEMAKKWKTKDPASWGSEAGGMFREKVRKVIRQKLPLDKIKHKLLVFKQETARKMSADDSYAFWMYGGSSMGGSGKVLRPVPIPKEDVSKKSALLMFSVDTSGSMDDDDYKLVYGWLDQIAEFFESPKNGGIPGRVYLLEWDTKLYTPVVRWRHQKKPIHQQEHQFRGGGGTAIEAMFEFLNHQFVEKHSAGDAVTNKFVWTRRPTSRAATRPGSSRSQATGCTRCLTRFRRPRSTRTVWGQGWERPSRATSATATSSSSQVPRRWPTCPSS